MNTRIIFGAVLLSLMVTIIVLAIELLQPPAELQKLTFDKIMTLTAEKRSQIKDATITYEVNLTTPEGLITGYMTFQKNSTSKKVTITPELSAYEDYGLLVEPETLIGFINESERREYSGVMQENERYCLSTITEPPNKYRKIINGEYLFVTCFDPDSGYPILAYLSEIKGETVSYSKLFIKNETYII